MVRGTIDISTRLHMITVPKPNACHESTSFCTGGRDSNPSDRAKDRTLTSRGDVVRLLRRDLGRFEGRSFDFRGIPAAPDQGERST